MEKKLTAQEIAEILELEPLEQEGGMFRSTYRLKSETGGRDICNAIYYLLSNGAFSHLHRLSSDEIYNFYMGDPLELLELHPDGTVRHVILGNDLLAGHRPQVVIRAGCWHGSRVVPGGDYALVGTSMAPGFADDDYEHCTNPKELIRQYPEWKDIILALTGTVKHN